MKSRALLQPEVDSQRCVSMQGLFGLPLIQPIRGELMNRICTLSVSVLLACAGCAIEQ